MAVNSYDAVIVGGGHNGLVAAGYLARAGLQVIVLERRPVVGGPCARIEFLPGYHSSITNSPGSFEPKIVHDMRLEEFGLRFMRADPSMVHPYEDGRMFRAWRDKDRVVDELRSFSEHDAVAYYEVFELYTRFAQTLRVSLFEPPPTWAELTARLRTPEDEDMFARIMLGSIRDLLDGWIESEEVGALLTILSVMGNWVGPSTPGTAFHLLMRPLSLASMSVEVKDDPRLQPLRGSTGLPMGGMGSIPEAMERFLKHHGAVIRTNVEVARILTRDGAVTGVALANGEEVHGRIVLSNLNPKTTFLDLLAPSDLPADFVERVRGLSMRGSAFKMVLALDGLPRFRAARTPEETEAYARCQFRIAPSMAYIERAFDDARDGHWSRYPVMWGLTPTVADPSLAPPGKHLMSVNIWHAPYDLRDGLSWETERDRFGKRCIDVLAEYVPNLKDILIDHRFFSPRDIEEEFGMLGSNITHGDMIPSRMFSLRPLAGCSDYRTPVRGLYLCGSGTWPGGYVSGLPGHNASHQVLRDLAAGAEQTFLTTPDNRL